MKSATEAPEPVIPPELISRATDDAVKVQDNSVMIGTWERASVLHGLTAVRLVEALVEGDPRVSDEMLLVEVKKAIRAARLALRDNGAFEFDGMRGVVSHWRAQPSLSPEEDALRQEGMALMWVRVFTQLHEMTKWTEAQWLEADLEEARYDMERATDSGARARLQQHVASLEVQLADELKREKATAEALDAPREN